MDQVEELCQRFKIWVISYSSPSHPNPVLLIWYTDKDETDRLLTDQSGDIVAFVSSANLVSNLLKKLSDFALSERFVHWLDSVSGLEPVVNARYDIKLLVDSLKEANLDIPTIEGLATWLNLFNDFAHQDTRNKYLNSVSEDKLLRKAWQYYYDYIFWPRFNDEEKFATWDRPPLVINTHLLIEKLMATTDAFEARLHLVEVPYELT